MNKTYFKPKIPINDTCQLFSSIQVVKLPGYQVARLPSCQVAKLPGCRAAKLPWCRIKNENAVRSLIITTSQGLWYKISRSLVQSGS